MGREDWKNKDKLKGKHHLTSTLGLGRGTENSTREEKEVLMQLKETREF